MIVGGNFESEVLKSKKNVLMLICSVLIEDCLDIIKFFIQLGD